MTSIADPALPASRPSWIRIVLLGLLLVLFATQSPPPWGRLWLMVPVAVAVSLLAAWRFGPWSVIVPVALFAGAMIFGGPQSLWVWWIPATALSGAWMGLREEGGGTGPGARAWMLLPVLTLAVGLPWMLRYPDLLHGLDRELQLGDRQFIDLARELGSTADRVAKMQQVIEANAKLRSEALPYVLPTFVFVWMAMLVVAGRWFAARVASTLRWPALSRVRLGEWRLPDGALWVLIAGLVLIVAQWGAGAPSGWTLLLNAGLGYCIQGIAVVESLLLARGVPPSVIVVTMAFAFTLAMPVFMLTTVVVGLSDAWLDYRRMEAPSETETP